MSLRRDLVVKVKTRFATITTASGYQTNIGSKIKVWHNSSLDAGQLDAIIIRDLDDTKDPDDPNSGRKTWKLRITADAVFQPSTDNEANAEKARKAIEDICTAVALDDRWDKLARRTDEVKTSLLLAKDELTVAGSRVTFDIVTSRSPWTS